MKAAIALLQHTALGSGQCLARHIITLVEQLKEPGVKVEVHWKPGPGGVEGNERANGAAKVVAKARGI